MKFFAHAAGLQGGRISQAELTGPETWLDDLAETLWMYQLAQLGLGFNPDLLALSERSGAFRASPGEAS
jgi:hypothetical protein